MSSFLLQNLDAVASSAGSIALTEPRDGVVTLRISGGKPIRMNAELLAECSS
jgi:hypothetical protein